MAHLPITRRQFQILRMLCAGEGEEEIATELGIDAKTVGVHRANIMARTKVHSIEEICPLAGAEDQLEALAGRPVPPPGPLRKYPRPPDYKSTFRRYPEKAE